MTAATAATLATASAVVIRISTSAAMASSLDREPWLQSLEDAIAYRRGRLAVRCRDWVATVPGRKCGDHARDLDLVAEYLQVRRHGHDFRNSGRLGCRGIPVDAHCWEQGWDRHPGVRSDGHQGLGHQEDPVSGPLSAVRWTWPSRSRDTERPPLPSPGPCPPGLTFTDNGNGTAAIAGTPAVGSVGRYLITITATNTSGTATQHFAIAIS
jgi:hypothetical protein